MNWIEKLPSQMAENLKRKIAKDFSKVYLTHNLVDTMNVEARANQATLHIPAIRYDFKEWNKNKVVVHHPEWGSYANQVNITGGFSTFHTNYIDIAIRELVNVEMRISRLYLKNKKIVEYDMMVHYEPSMGLSVKQAMDITKAKDHRKEYMKKQKAKRSKK